VAAWNPDLARLRGEVLGEEARFRKKDVLLGPGVNIIRSPLGGRNFEYMSEDPFLNARLAVPYIQGLQSRDVAASVKHYLANNQETNRTTVDVLMSERALREIYLPAFKGFKGVTMTDWGGSHSTVKAALAGLDLEMGTTVDDYNQWFFADPLIAAVKSGAVPESIVDEKVANVLRVMIQTKVLDPKKRFNKGQQREHEYAGASASRLSVGRGIHRSA